MQLLLLYCQPHTTSAASDNNINKCVLPGRGAVGEAASVELSLSCGSARHNVASPSSYQMQSCHKKNACTYCTAVFGFVLIKYNTCKYIIPSTLYGVQRLLPPTTNNVWKPVTIQIQTPFTGTSLSQNGPPFPGGGRPENDIRKKSRSENDEFRPCSWICRCRLLRSNTCIMNRYQ